MKATREVVLKKTSGASRQIFDIAHYLHAFVRNGSTLQVDEASYEYWLLSRSKDYGSRLPAGSKNNIAYFDFLKQAVYF